MRLRHLLLPLLAVPLLSACVNDGATYEIDNTREHVLSLIREQPYFWENKVNFYLVVSRMPTCMRRHPMGSGSPNAKVEIYQAPSGAFIVKVGKRLYVTETQTCENFIKMDAEPPEGMGKFIGTFRPKNGQLVFVKEEAEAEDKPAE
ncbi:hypothetical protein GBK02_04545 [Dechloromonas sp. TW-R-39-2]|uniref:hypothetical protein n=1 Tax=Dechloromonas sp. TW-R-39-2 TaxID=2654218 RepID=UPI00193DCFFD|nr:hypothetical protein [Dechloromonas sp. TW-R-39-2]QRM18715.1 hypothetical protein GBK02_04545 [Dechloromonas sp. TW-R-39-2]